MVRVVRLNLCKLLWNNNKSPKPINQTNQIEYNTLFTHLHIKHALDDTGCRFMSYLIIQNLCDVHEHTSRTLTHSPSLGHYPYGRTPTQFIYKYVYKICITIGWYFRNKFIKKWFGAKWKERKKEREITKERNNKFLNRIGFLSYY